jgi:hypothetical protein
VIRRLVVIGAVLSVHAGTALMRRRFWQGGWILGCGAHATLLELLGRWFAVIVSSEVSPVL